MAFSAREVVMTFRGQNYLSGAIRRVGRDVGSLSRISALSQQRAAAAIASARARNSLATTRAEQAALASTGSRAVALEQRRLQLGVNEQRQVAQVSALYQERLALQRDQILNEERLLRLYEAQAKGQAFVGRGTNRIGTSEAIRATEADYARLAERVQYLTAQEDIQIDVMSKSSVAAQKLTADYAAQAARLAQLTEIERTQIAAAEQRALVEQRLALQETRILPVQTWQDRARAVEHFGRVLQMTGLIATAVLGATARASANLSTQVTLAATQARPAGAGANVTAGIRDRIQKQTLDIMKDLPFNGQDVADSFYQIFSGTKIQSVPRASNMIRQFGRAAVASGTDLKTMTDVGLTMFNVFGREFNGPQGPTKAMNAFLAAVRYGRMNAEQFANALPNVVAISKRVGLSFYDIAGAMAALTRQTGGKFTNRDATGIARMIEIFARPDFVAGAHKMGVEIKDLHGNMRPLVDIITQFAAKTRGTGGIDAINMFKEITGKGSASGTGGTQGTIQARRAFSFLINDAEQYRHVTKLVRQDNNELAQSFAIMSRSPGVRWTLFINQMKVLAYQVGSAVMPAFISLGHSIAPIVHWFTRLSPGAQHALGMFLAIASIGSLLTGILLGMGGGIAVIVTQFMLWRRARSIEMMLELESAAVRTEAALAGTAAGVAGFASVEVLLTGGLILAIPLLIRYHAQVISVVGALGGLKAVLESLVIGGAVFFAVKWLPQLIRMVAELRAAVAVMQALRAAAITAAIAEEAMGAASVVAAGEVGILGGVLATLFAPEVLAGLAAVAAALLLIKANSRVPGEIAQNQTGILSRTAEGQYTKTLVGGKGMAVQVPISGADAAQQFPDSLPARLRARHRAIVEAIADSPRYTHAINANQKAVNNFNKELQRQANLVNRVQVHQAVQQISHQPTLISAINHIRALRVQAEQSPSVGAATKNWNAYYDALGKLLSGRTKTQIQAIRQILKTAAISPAVLKMVPQDWINKIERLHKVALANPTSIAAQQAYEQAVAQLNERYKAQPSLLAAINDVMGTYDQNLKDTTGSAKTLGTTFQDVLGSIQSMYQNFQSQEQTIMGTLFEGPFVKRQDKFAWGAGFTGSDALHDIRSQITQFRNFHGLLNNLQRRGAPNALIDQLAQMGPDSIKQIRALRQMSQPELQRYFGMFREQQNLVHQQAMRDLQRQLTIYRRHGRNIALAIVAGLRDENVTLTNALTKMVRKMFPGLPVGATGAGGRATHHPKPQKVDVKVDVHHHDKNSNTPPITKKAQERHRVIREKGKYAAPTVGGPR